SSGPSAAGRGGAARASENWGGGGRPPLLPPHQQVAAVRVDEIAGDAQRRRQEARQADIDLPGMGHLEVLADAVVARNEAFGPERGDVRKLALSERVGEATTYRRAARRRSPDCRRYRIADRSSR